jgi:hypothetical protein
MITEDATYHGPKRRFSTTQLPRVTFKNNEGLKFQRTGRLRDASYWITTRLSIHWLAKWFAIDDRKNNGHRPSPTGPSSKYLLCACLCTFLLSANCVLFPLHDTHVGCCCSWREYVQLRAGGHLKHPLSSLALRGLYVMNECRAWHTGGTTTPSPSLPQQNAIFNRI